MVIEEKRKTKGPDQHTVYREIEKKVNITVCSDKPSDGKCNQCKKMGMVFYCHFFREGAIRCLCKPCVIAMAGGEDKVWVRTTMKRDVWEKLRRREMAEGQKEKMRQSRVR